MGSGLGSSGKCARIRENSLLLEAGSCTLSLVYVNVVVPERCVDDGLGLVASLLLVEQCISGIDQAGRLCKSASSESSCTFWIHGRRRNAVVVITLA
jgi:hypothetical protein